MSLLRSDGDAVANVLKVWWPGDGVSGNVDVGGTLSAEFSVFYFVLFDVIHDDITLVIDADATALTPAAPAGYNKKLPPFGDARGSYTLLAKKPQRQKDGRVWQVECVYRLAVPGQETRPDDIEETPNWAINVSIHPLPYDEEIQYWKEPATAYIASEPPTALFTFGSAFIQNTAQDAIAGVTIQRHIDEIVVTFNTAAPDFVGIGAAYGTDGRGTTNSEAFDLVVHGVTYHFEEEEVLFKSAGIDIRKDSQGVFCQMTYTLHRKIGGWLRKIPNKGLNSLTGGVKAAFKNGPANITSPVYLSTDSFSGNVTRAIDGNNVEYIEGRIYDHVDLGEILLHDLGVA